MGNYMGSVLCIHHRDSNASMAIYYDEERQYKVFPYTYYCFGCKASGYLSEDEFEDLLETRQANNQPLIKEVVLKDSFSPEAKEFLASRNIESKWYIDYGIKETVEGNLYLPCYDYNRGEIGYQLRSIYNFSIRVGNNVHSPKIWSCPGKDGTYPSYSVIYGYESKESAYQQYRQLVIVESVLDGLSLWSRCGYMSVAVLGTNPSPQFFRFINLHVDKGISTVWIIFDPDAPGQEAAVRLVDKLRVLGYNVSNIQFDDVVYRVNKSRIEGVLG